MPSGQEAKTNDHELGSIHVEHKHRQMAQYVTLASSLDSHVSTTVAPVSLPWLTIIATDPIWPDDERGKCMNLTHKRVYFGKQNRWWLCYCATQGVALKFNDKGKPSQRADLWAVYFAVYLCRKGLKVRIYMGGDNWLGHGIRVLKTERLNYWEQRDLR